MTGAAPQYQNSQKEDYGKYSAIRTESPGRRLGLICRW